MKVKYINPFIESTRQLMEVMVGTEEFQKKNLRVDDQIKTSFDISAVIGISGDCIGSIVLSFSEDIALKIVSAILGETVAEIDNDACDVIGEMVNIISGNAISELSENGTARIERSTPSVFTGKGLRVKRLSNIPCINIFFTTELGEFAMQVSLKLLKEI